MTQIREYRRRVSELAKALSSGQYAKDADRLAPGLRTLDTDLYSLQGVMCEVYRLQTGMGAWSRPSEISDHWSFSLVPSPRVNRRARIRAKPGPPPTTPIGFQYSCPQPVVEYFGFQDPEGTFLIDEPQMQVLQRIWWNLDRKPHLGQTTSLVRLDECWEGRVTEGCAQGAMFTILAHLILTYPKLMFHWLVDSKSNVKEGWLRA